MAITAMQLKATIESLMAKARDPYTSEAEKKASLAEALAYWSELTAADEKENLAFDQNRVNRNLERFYHSYALSAASRLGELTELASLSPKAINDRLTALGNEISRYAGGGEEKAARAERLYEQMNRTWRISSNSKEFDAAKKAMQEVAEKENPTQLDNYLAANALQKYISKNLRRAKSATGMTRMAVSLAFLKQTMTREGFEAYCDNLNVLRGIKHTTGGNGRLSFRLEDPRCIEPDTVGTVGEVYRTFRERFHEYAAGSKLDKDIDPRDLAMLTALKNLEAKSKDGENLVVEHEALTAELEKVQKDRRFQNAIESKSREELIEMAWGGNCDTLDGYTKPLSPQQQERVKEEQNRIAKEKAAREEAERQARLKREQEERERIEKQRQLEEENRKKEQERLKKEQEERELRSKQRSLTELHEELMPQIQEMSHPLDSVFAILNDEAEQEKNVELFAKMITLGEYQKQYTSREDKTQKGMMVNLKEYSDRVETLKKDPAVRKMAKELREDQRMSKLIETYTREAEKKKQLSERERKIFPSAYMAANLRIMYNEAIGKGEHKAEKIKTASVSKLYDQVSGKIGDIINGGYGLQKMSRLVAMSVAIQELKGKGEGIDEDHLDEAALKKRSNELSKDPDVQKIAQTLVGPSTQEKMKKKFASSKEQGRDFVEMANGMVKEAAEKRLAKNKEKEKGMAAGK